MKIERDALLRLVGAIMATTDEEIDCDEWLTRVSALLELRARGAAVPDELRSVAQHIEVCQACAEEFRALLDVLTSQS